MVTLTIDEITLNATRAALELRVEHLEKCVRFSEAVVTHLTLAGSPIPEDSQRDLVWNIAALHETRMAVEFYAEVEPMVDHPADASYHDWQAVGPR